MRYRVDLTARARRDLQHIFETINAASSEQAHAWFNGLEAAILSLDELPARGSATPENGNLRHLLYGSTRYVYRVIYAIDDDRRVVTVLHIRHGARQPVA